MALLKILVARKLDKRLFKGAKAPEAPDPYKVADAQTQANITSAEKEAALNRYNQVSPFGNTTWSKQGDQWTSTFELSPEIKGMLSQYQNAASTPFTPVTAGQLPAAPSAGSLPDVQSGQAYREGGAKDWTRDTAGIQQAMDLRGQAAGAAAGANPRLDVYSKDFDYSGLQNKLPTADEATRKAVEDAYYARQTSRLDPQYANFEQQMRSRLANQGLTEGSEAYNRELQQFMQGRNDAYSTARNDATTNSTSELAKLFGMGLAGRQQEVGEANYLRGLPLAEAQGLGQLYSGYNSDVNQNLQTQLNQNVAGSNIAAQQAQLDSNLRTNALNEQSKLRGDALNEALLLNDQGRSNRQQMLNELLGLTTGSQVQGGGAGQIAVGAAPIAQSIYNTYQGQLQAQQNANQYKSGLIGGIAQAGASAAAAY